MKCSELGWVGFCCWATLVLLAPVAGASRSSAAAAAQQADQFRENYLDGRGAGGLSFLEGLDEALVLHDQSTPLLFDNNVKSQKIPAGSRLGRAMAQYLKRALELLRSLMRTIKRMLSGGAAMVFDVVKGLIMSLERVLRTVLRVLRIYGSEPSGQVSNWVRPAAKTHPNFVIVPSEDIRSPAPSWFFAEDKTTSTICSAEDAPVAELFVEEQVDLPKSAMQEQTVEEEQDDAFCEAEDATGFDVTFVSILAALLSGGLTFGTIAGLYSAILTPSDWHESLLSQQQEENVPSFIMTRSRSRSLSNGYKLKDGKMTPILGDDDDNQSVATEVDSDYDPSEYGPMTARKWIAGM
jgi:hypothetical protein